MPATLMEAADLIAQFKGGEGEADPLPIASDSTLKRHLLWLDDAMDCLLRDDLQKAREAGTFLGGGIATDESPPSQPRFRGLRFQVTFFYIPWIRDVAAWEACSAPPRLMKSTGPRARLASL